ncbi:hypothetical protein [Natronorubrum daqingense]|uniref:hypothetical protein n=1 Tax=Natronorubrum daqingense TaxID=588898 RepID=UPI001115742B|nr:hypothetical protein [Natronorubrum daqingense]
MDVEVTPENIFTGLFAFLIVVTAGPAISSAKSEAAWSLLHTAVFDVSGLAPRMVVVWTAVIVLLAVPGYVALAKIPFESRG